MAICGFCGREMLTAVTCSVDALHQDGEHIAMLRWGSEPGWAATRRCGDCCTMPGGFHHLGCDVQRCSVCGGQMITCGCRFDEDGPDDDDDDYDDDDYFEDDATVADISVTTALRTVVRDEFPESG